MKLETSWKDLHKILRKSVQWGPELFHADGQNLHKDGHRIIQDMTKQNFFFFFFFAILRKLLKLRNISAVTASSLVRNLLIGEGELYSESFQTDLILFLTCQIQSLHYTLHSASTEFLRNGLYRVIKKSLCT